MLWTLDVLNGKEGSGYAVHAESRLNELLPSILRRVAKMIEPENSACHLSSLRWPLER
jgi:hypothetical protein